MAGPRCLRDAARGAAATSRRVACWGRTSEAAVRWRGLENIGHRVRWGLFGIVLFK